MSSHSLLLLTTIAALLTAGCQTEKADTPSSSSSPTETQTASIGASASDPQEREKPAQRYGMIVGIKAEQLERYRQLHANPWEGVLDQLDRSNVRNYSIWLVELRPGEHYLFGYLEYTGEDFDADMKAMGDDETTRKWWKETDPCQTPIPTAGKGEQWVMMEEVFYHDRDRRGTSLMPAPATFQAGKAAVPSPQAREDEMD